MTPHRTPDLPSFIYSHKASIDLDRVRYTSIADDIDLESKVEVLIEATSQRFSSTEASNTSCYVAHTDYLDLEMRNTLPNMLVAYTLIAPNAYLIHRVMVWRKD